MTRFLLAAAAAGCALGVAACDTPTLADFDEIFSTGSQAGLLCAAHVADEIHVGLAAMRGDGFTPTSFAYPFGRHTAVLDAALLQEFRIVRSTSRHCADR